MDNMNANNVMETSNLDTNSNPETNMNTTNTTTENVQVAETPTVTNQSADQSPNQSPNQTPEKKRAEVIPATEFIQTWLACYKAGQTMSDFCRKTGISSQNAKSRFENYRDRIRSERKMELPELPKRSRSLNMDDIDAVLKSSGVNLHSVDGTVTPKKKAKKS